MLEVLCKRKTIRDFLKQYSTEAWPQIIPYICEIAIFNLQNSFGTLMFSKDDFKNIIHNLKNHRKKKDTQKSTGKKTYMIISYTELSTFHQSPKKDLTQLNLTKDAIRHSVIVAVNIRTFLLKLNHR